MVGRGFPAFFCINGERVAGFLVQMYIVKVKGDGFEMLNRKNIAEEIRHYAESQAQVLVERKHRDGCSYDVDRPATEDEAKVIAGVLYGGIYAITLDGKDEQTVKDTCELIAMQLLPKSVNCYDTIYNRIKEVE